MEDQNISAGAEAPASEYVSQASFEDFGLSEELRRGVADKGYQHPTPVQAQTVKPILAGKDIIVRSKTGTGKTAAFGIPILEKVPAGRRQASALVMCPTRELALQVADELRELAKHKDLTVLAVYGGTGMGEQLEKLKAGAEIIVGTPGRIQDHIQRGTLKLDHVLVSCLDEADEMLDMGFFEDVTRILDRLPDDCQQLLFSATVPADIEQIIRKYLTTPETILLSGDEYRVDNIRNVVYPTVDAYPKPRNLLYMIEAEEPESAILFCNTRSDTSLVTAVLNRNGYDAELLNGDLPQKERERVMAKVKKGELRFMVATDIAARGIDISDLTHVINYSLPEDPAVYLHRVGRTGRIGKKGTAVSLVSGAEMMTFKTLKNKYAIEFEEKALPSPEEARKTWLDRHVGRLKDGMSTSVFEAYIPLAQELKARQDGEWLMSYALKYFFTHQHMERVQELQKAEHKLEEHERKVAGEEPRREQHERGGQRERQEGGRERREGRGRNERGERKGRQGRERHEGAASVPGTAIPAAPAGGEAAPEAGVREVPIAAGEGTPAAQEPRQPARGKVFLKLGEKDGADEAKVRAAVGALAPELQLLGVEVRGSHSYLIVPPEAVEGAVAALDGKEFEGVKLGAEKARRRRSR
ncbi:MAG TPA: DEAD/DEAH box helicase [Anaeromyxobacteraceae bacterium]|jgi:ATP-dependent RNA helicase DeaD|nr:DEAD/DEAH box helicase [Anaeromyxobacteraceae bacterium]